MTKRLKFFILISLLFFSNPTIHHQVQSEVAKGYQKKYYEPNPRIHAPTFTTSIMIFKDDDFLNYTLPGNGTLIQPYIIENFSIETTNSTGIHVSGTTKHFIIRNGYVDAEQYGIWIDDVAENTSKIMNVTCSFNNKTLDSAGISVYSADGIQLIDNICTNNCKRKYLCG